MLTPQKLTLAVLIQAALLSSAYASEQSEAKGFLEDAEGSVLFRTGYISRDKKNGIEDTSSYAQSAIVELNSGFTQGVVGFGVGVLGDGSIKLGSNNNAGNQMIPLHNDGSAYDHWGRGGGNVKARFSNTTAVYGTQVLDLPVLASNTGRMVPEYFEGTLVTSREIKGLELTAGKFTKDQMSDQINSDADAGGKGLDRAIIWGAKYKFDDQLSASYYGLDSKNALERHYVNANYKLPLADKSSLTFDFSGYHTEWDKAAATYSSTIGNKDVDGRSNNIWALSSTYNQGPHSVMLAYNKTQAIQVMTMVKMLMASRVFIYQTHICLTLLATMKNQHNCNIT